MARKRKLLNLYEAAERLQVPVGWLKEMALNDQLPCLRVGKRKLRFELNAVKAAISKMAARGDKKAPKQSTVLSEGAR